MVRTMMARAYTSRVVSLALYLVSGAALLCAQATPPDAGATISVNVNLVVLHATVLNKQGGFVSGLSKDDFRVYADGRPQIIRTFQHEDIPAAVGLLVDDSGSMSTKRKDVGIAALEFVHSSNQQDQIFVVNFNEHVSLGLPAGEPFSADPVQLEVALNGVPASGETALYDAIESGLSHLKEATLDRKALIVISDGGDNASRHTLEQVLEDAGRSNVVIYTVGLFGEYDEDQNPVVLRKIARLTGGETFLPKETNQVIPICKRIAEDIRNQYIISFIPSGKEMDRSYHKLRVTATGQHGHKYVVRTRAGFIAPPQRAQ
jgi:Ca-activated chloride channel family protein